MWTKNEPKIKKEIECDICKTHIMSADLKDLDWSEAKMNFNEPFIKCPICDNKIFDCLDVKDDD